MARLIKNIGTQHHRIIALNYPLFHPKLIKNRNNALLGIGGNMGDVLRRFEHLYTFLVKSPLVTVIETSPILRNPPFGYMDQDDFLNALIYIQTDLTAMELLEYILRVEKRFGRKRSFANAPRTLDIDMIFYNSQIIDRPRLKVPHPYWKERESVTVPLEQMKGLTWLKRHL